MKICAGCGHAYQVLCDGLCIPCDALFYPAEPEPITAAVTMLRPLPTLEEPGLFPPLRSAS